MRPERLSQLLRGHQTPDEEAAEERAWRVVRAAFAARTHRAPRHRARRGALAVALAALLATAAFTAPGQAVTDWVRDTVDPGRDDAKEALVSLPAPGRILVVSAAGPWIVDRDGSRRLLGDYADAAWSPRGRFVVATRRNDLVALDPKGAVRWSLARSPAPGTPRWSPDGFRIAYRSGGGLRVVAGDGSGDRAVARRITAVPPAWRPARRHEVAFAEAGGRIALVDSDTGRRRWAVRAARSPRQLSWSADGQRLLAVDRDGVTVHDARGRVRSRLRSPRGARVAAAAFSREGHSFAIAVRAAGGARGYVEHVRPRAARSVRTRVLSGAGSFGALAWSPNGDWLLISWPAADQWVFVRTGGAGSSTARRLLAVSNITAQLTPGDGGAAFPRLAGWCCPP